MAPVLTCEVDVAVACANQLGESPIWSAAEGGLWWLDIGDPGLWRLGVDGQVERWPLPKPAGCLALRDDGGLLLAFRSQIALLDSPDASPRWIDAEGLALGDDRFNDGKCDRAGRFWVGTMDRRMRDPVGRLYRFDGPGRCEPMASGFTLSNGIGWSPDSQTMYFADTVSQQIHAFDYDLAAGQISRQRVFVQGTAGPGGPDGLTVDADGGVWSAWFGRGCLHRHDPQGRLERSIKLPVSQPTSVMFGGPGLGTLYVTTATVGMDERQRAHEPLAGSLLRVHPGVVGLPEPRIASPAAAMALPSESLHG